MTKDYVFITNENGEQERVSYSELDHEVYPQLLKPIGGFCYPANRYLQVPLPEVPFYIQNWLPKPGKMLIYAPAKAGKSFLCLQIADSIGSGEDFLGIPTSQGSVLYVQCELGERVLQDRLRLTGRSYDNVYVGTTFSMKLDTPAGRDYLFVALDAIKPKVLIIDPWYKIIAGDENESKDARTITDILDDLIETFQCSVVVMHHPGKDISKGGRGSSILEDWVDSYIEMRKLSKEGEPLRIRLTPKLLRHCGLPTEPTEAVMDKYGCFNLDGALETVHDKVVRLFKGSPDTVLTPNDFTTAKLGNPKSIYNALRELIDEERVQRVSRGGYRWLGVPTNGDSST